MSTALALTSCEAQNIAAETGQGTKLGKGKALDTSDGFKKELENCEAMIIPAQPDATDGSIPNAEAGKQPDPGMIEGLPGVSCVFEGVEGPVNPLDVAQTQGQADMPMIPVDGMAEQSSADGQQADSTSESNARMQQTEAGGTSSTPVKTQDQILETVGAYIDQAAEAGEKSGPLTPQTASAQAAAPPQEGQNPAAVKVAGQSGEGAEAVAVQTAAGPVAAKTNEHTAMDTVEGTATGKSEYAAAGKGGYAATDRAGSTVSEQSENAAMGKAEDAMTGKAEGTGKREPLVKADSLEEPGKTNAAAPVTDHRETVSAVKDAPVKAAPQPGTEEAAQYSKENVLRIVDKVSTQASEGRYDFDVELKPEFLGKVNIRLTMEDGVIRMQIKTDDMSVRGMLTDQTASLQNALKEKGITLSSVDVTYDSQASLDGGKQPFEQNDGQRRQGGTYYAHAESTGYEPAVEPYSYYVGNSSVEFLA